MWEHFDRIIETCRRQGRDRGASRRDLERQLAANTQFIWLRRRNQVRQAVSWAKALQSNVWHIEAQRDYRGAYVYDFLGVLVARHRIERAEAVWQDYFDRCGVEPLVLYYEDYLEDMCGSVRAVSEMLGVETPTNIETQTELLKVQSDAASDEWERRFQQDRRGPAASALALAKGFFSPAWWGAYYRRATDRAVARTYSGR